ncbi:MAG: FAD-dependent oxidoreductase [Chitinivibrionales bacterium]|nr:FAD-dependent oxidoreductase [Chitinivibrionales bacterium]MBD3394920.1 FAD-dependent oxidoreductase [Chitinivibrionales bacterium]
MATPTYHVAIVGAGVCGSAIARCLSAYKLDVVLLEKCTDVGFGVSKANSGIIHAGFHHQSHSLKARLEIQGNLMFEKLHHELGFPFRRVGILVVAFSQEQMKTVAHLYAQGLANGVEGLEICGAQRIHTLEPKLNPDAVGGLHAPSGGIIEPYRFVFALAECARNNGVEIITDFELTRATPVRGGYRLISRDGTEVSARYIVNAAGLYADTVSRILGAERFRIHPRKGEEYLLDRNAACYPGHVLFPVPAKNSKGILVIPTVEGTTMIGPTAHNINDKKDVSTTSDNLETVFTSAVHMVPLVSRRDIITAFAGIRPVLDTSDFFIAISTKARRVVQVAGIQSPGLTASPAIAELVKNLLKQAGLKLTEKRSFRARLEKVVTARSQTPETMARLADNDPRYANIVCRCETVSEAEIVEAIRKGHTTLDGIKFYTRAGMGRCQGGFCTYKILKILARETGKHISAFTKRGAGSYEVSGRLGEGQER